MHIYQVRQKEKNKKNSAATKGLSSRVTFLYIGKKTISKDLCPDNIDKNYDNPPTLHEFLTRCDPWATR